MIEKMRTGCRAHKSIGTHDRANGMSNNADRQRRRSAVGFINLNDKSIDKGINIQYNFIGKPEKRNMYQYSFRP